MNFRMGGHTFANVEIPLLWGTRAIVEDKEGRISVISLEGTEAKLEILGNKPAPEIPYEIIEDGFKILENDTEMYSFSPKTGTFTGHALRLPECQIERTKIRVGSNTFSGNVVSDSGVGIVVTETSIGMGAPLPEGLAKLSV